MDLHALQQWMQDAVLQAAPVGRGEVEQHFVASPRLDARERLAIYQRSYLLRLLSCLREQFPALCHALGDELFDGFAREFLQELPSESYTLCDLGQRFPGYLEASRPDREAPPEAREPWIDFMVDLSTFERAVFVMFDAPGHEGKPFAIVETPDARLRLQPCFALHESRFPVAVYYHQVKSGHVPAWPPREAAFTALVRTDYTVRSLPLTPAQFAFLQALSAGATVPPALAVLVPGAGPAEAHHAWMNVRKRWIEGGMFIEEKDRPDLGARLPS